MGRVIKAHGVRRDELLDAAQRLLVTKGYELMTVQDVLDACGIAKGTFYHYFDSKQAIVQATLERRFAQVEAVISPIADLPALDGIAKLQRMLDAIGAWKAAERSFITALLPLLLAEDDGRVLVHSRDMARRIVRPTFERVLAQAREEGHALVAEPADLAEMVFALLDGARDRLRQVLREGGAAREIERVLTAITTAYADAVGRLIGLPSGALQLGDPAAIAVWSEVIAQREARP